MSAKIHAFPLGRTLHTLFEHPDGEGAIEYGGGILIVANDMDATVARVLIGPAGMRDLASRLCNLADSLEREGAA